MPNIMLTPEQERRALHALLSKTTRGAGCWIWSGAKSLSGYGRTGIPQVRKTTQAHRLMFKIAYGRWPEGDCCHTCDVRSCIRPAHLFEGTRAANMLDAMVKGRLRRKWSQEQVDLVIAMRRGGKLHKEISAHTGMPISTVGWLLASRGHAGPPRGRV